MSYELGIIGAGAMAEAIARGLLRAKLLAPAQIIAADVAVPRRELFAKELGVTAVGDNAAAARDAKVLLLSVKPQQMKAALASLGAAIRPDTLVISIMAGITSSSIEANLGPRAPWRVVRSMPNTPMLVGEGIVAIARGRNATDADLATARRLFEAAAMVVELPEDRMDVVTAVSGSAPAYFYFLVEQLVKAGIEMGLTPEQAHLFATRNALGAGKMMVQSADSPAELRRKVTSPNGTTQAAIESMQAKQVGESLVAAFKRAAERARELSA